jgi:transcription elongation GreA/GreB family factor
MQEIQKNYLTKEGYDNALDELHDLQKNKLPNILERLKEAISQ